MHLSTPRAGQQHISLPELAGTGAIEALDEVYRTGRTKTVRELHAPAVRGGVLGDHWFDVTWQAVRDPAGNVTGVLVTAVEVTDHVAARRALHRAVALRDEFLSVASHELRTPLTALSLHLEGDVAGLAGCVAPAIGPGNIRHRRPSGAPL